MIVPKEKIKLVETIIKSVGDKYNFTFEDSFYKKMIFKNVNNYIAVDTKGNIKKKGLFVTKPELGNSVNELVIPKALEAYFIKGIDYVNFIKNHTNVSDFLISKKVNRKYDVFWFKQGENGFPEKVECQRLNRYYASSKNGYLKKKYGKTESHLLKDSGVTIYNKLIPDHFPSDINYRYYINKTSKIIKELEKNKKQLELF